MYEDPANAESDLEKYDILVSTAVQTARRIEDGGCSSSQCVSVRQHHQQIV